ncbi:MAG: hypothetical protein IJU54_01060 [Alphaproteobacteria bacterium]|nr:hypothetical protein [Alphaproteobacteria bacterium]
MCLAICSNNIWQFYISIELLGIISSVFVGIENHNDNITKSATTVYTYNKFASIVFLFGTILYLLNNPKYNEVSIICLTIACLCKSAQIPFSNWLLKATHANTLASILIHCATIIGIGVIFISKFHVFFDEYQYILKIILIISLFTSIIYSILALYKTNIKKIIACLTISSTGIMLSLCALKQYSISISYFLCHAFFKSLLFLIFAYYMEYFKTKYIRNFKNLKQLNNVGLIAVLSSIGIPPFIGSVSKLLIGSTLHDYPLLINIAIEISNCLMNIVIFKLYLQYFKDNKDSIDVKFNIKPIYVLIIASIIYSFILIALFDYNVKHACISIIENVLVILLSYIIARKISDIPFNKRQIKVFKQIDYSFIYKQIDVLNKKIEKFYNNMFYNYQYKLANNLVYINNSQYKNQVRHLLIGLLIVCIILLF